MGTDFSKFEGSAHVCFTNSSGRQSKKNKKIKPTTNSQHQKHKEEKGFQLANGQYQTLRFHNFMTNAESE
jgi:hypothetical protein